MQSLCPKGLHAISAIDREFLKRLPALTQAAQPEIIRRIKKLVELESPSQNKGAVDRVLSAFAIWCRSCGGRVKIHSNSEVGNSLEIRFGPASTRLKPLLLLTHLDTVWDVGTLSLMPWREDDDKIAGPGVFDMKAGVVMGLMAIKLLLRHNVLKRPVIMLVHGDEEIGSPASRALTEKVASACAAVYVLEPGQGEGGAYKTARKGIGHYRLDVHGVASHAGVDFASGQSAILEVARQIERIAGFCNPATGLTVNPGVVGGGTRSNVVPAHAWVEIDVRASTMKDAQSVDRRLRRLKPFNAGCSLCLTGQLNRPPMVRTPEIGGLFHRAQWLYDQMGLGNLEEASTGGASDGNFTAALGIPTLDGMGAVGGGAHADHEHMLKAYLVPRTALLAAMLLYSA